jgi:hypothetical protein
MAYLISEERIWEGSGWKIAEDVGGHETSLRSESRRQVPRGILVTHSVLPPSKVRWMGGCYTTCVDLAAQSVPHSKPSTPAGFWLLLERIEP